MRLAKRIFRRLAREAATYRLIRQRRWEFKGDPNHRPDLVIKGCLNRAPSSIDDSVILKRIVRSYRKAKLAQKQASASYQVSNEWLPIYNHYLGPVMKALAEENLDELAGMYRNFFRDPCSTGLLGLSWDMDRFYFNRHIRKKHQLLYLYDVLCRYKLWHSLLGDGYTVQSLVSSDIGNPFGFEFDGVFVSHGSEYLHYYATQLNRLSAEDDTSLVVELGGGYGGLAYFLLRDSTRTTYVDFDLPENMALTAYYLLRALPQVKTVLYGEEPICAETLRNNRIVLMPNYEISKLPENSASIVFNSYSLAEMSSEAIDEYITHMTRISRKYFLHVNHTRDSLVSADDFEIEKKGYELLHRKPALWNRGRALEVDEYEYLYSKVRCS